MNCVKWIRMTMVRTNEFKSPSQTGAKPAGIEVAVVAAWHRAQPRTPVKVLAMHQPDLLSAAKNV